MKYLLIITMLSLCFTFDRQCNIETELDEGCQACCIESMCTHQFPDVCKTHGGIPQGHDLSCYADEPDDCAIVSCVECEEPDEEGCMDSNACNYDPNATVPDGCTYPMNVDCCDGNTYSLCSVHDCPVENDECGICGGDGSSCSGSVHLEIQNVNLTEGTLDIYMENDVPIAGFEFLIEGISSTGISGGYAELSGFDVMIYGNSPDCINVPQDKCSKILGFSFAGDLLQPNEGILTQITFVDNDDTICIATETNYPPYITPVISDVEADYIPVTVGDCFENDDNWVYGCTYETATNYNAEATFDDGSCEFLWGDMNHDGTLNVQDIIFLVNAILSGDWF